jgi:aryl-alcohol dehydrogenase-like predicted oxidoreductase
MEQPEYSLFKRARVEEEYSLLFKERRLGTTTWSPLASGLLSGKYLQGIPENSRFSLRGMEWLKDQWLNPKHQSAVEELSKLASALDCTLAQLAIAWCLKNPHVSTVITGATSEAQLVQNLGASSATAKLSEEVLDKIRKILLTHGV